MNMWSALVLISMTSVVGTVAFITGSPWSLLGLLAVALLGQTMIGKTRS